MGVSELRMPEVPGCSESAAGPKYLGLFVWGGQVATTVSSVIMSTHRPLGISDWHRPVIY